MLRHHVGMTPQETEERERRIAAQLLECRKRFVQHVRMALATSSPTRRKELYQKWRQDYGDDIARSYAKYAEGCFAGRSSIRPIERMIEEQA